MRVCLFQWRHRETRLISLVPHAVYPTLILILFFLLGPNIEETHSNLISTIFKANQESVTRATH